MFSLNWFAGIEDSEKLSFYMSENAVQKIITYVQNGFVQGEHLIFTYETSLKPLNQKQILPLIQQFLS